MTDSNEITKKNKKSIYARRLYWHVCAGLITFVATILRFYQIGLKPFHHDEGVNSHFLIRYIREGVYQYDPSNYHGPNLYFFAYFFEESFGLTDWSLRASVAVFGVLTVILVFYLRKVLGEYGTLFAAFFLAISPGMVFISRYFIHEMLFVFFSLGIVVAVVLFIKNERAGILAYGWVVLILIVSIFPSLLRLSNRAPIDSPTLRSGFRIGLFIVITLISITAARELRRWNNGRPIYFFLASASLAMLFATKETAFITLGTMLIACACVAFWCWFVDRDFVQNNRKLILIISNLVIAMSVIIAVLLNRISVSAYLTWYGEVFSNPEVPNQSFIYYSIVAIFGFGLVAWFIYLYKEIATNDARSGSNGLFEPTLKRFREAFGAHPIFVIAVSIFVFSYLGILFFSSFFTYPEGIGKAFEAYAIWTHTGSKDHTQNGYMGYVKWMMQIESPLVALSLLGGAIAILRGRERFPLFAAIWALGLFLAYSIIPYKTPWLALSFVLPMCLASGYGIERLIRDRGLVMKILAGILFTLSSFVLAFQTYDLGWVRYDSDRMPYVYAHTSRGFLGLIEEFDVYKQSSRMGPLLSINVFSPDYWAMPWYTRDLPKVYYSGTMSETSDTELIVINAAQRDEAVANFGKTYRYVGSYPLRPGVTLHLLARNDIAGYDAKDLDQIPR